MKDIKIIVATHKKYEMPKEDIFIPVQVGSQGKEPLGYQKDNEGKNISSKNPYYCELTGIYWAWKNLEAEYIGLVHYRRYFARSKLFDKNKFDKIITRKKLEKVLEKTDIILPKKRKYYIETIYSHYKHTMYIEPLDEAGKIIKEKYTEYYNEFEKLKKRRSAHMFNMFIMKKEYFDEYCKWLFPILFELEKRIDPKNYNDFHARYLGRISERLLDVWINTNKLKYKELDVVYMGKTNFARKVISVINAKITGKKYEKSF